MVRFLFAAICILTVLISSLYADTDTSDMKFKPIGYGAFEVGQIGNGYYKVQGQTIEPISHIWQQRAQTWFGYNVLIRQRLNINVAAGGLLVYSTPQIGTDPQTMQTRTLFGVKYAFASYPFVFSENLSAKFQLGYFPYKYNPDVRNLGENIFRTHAYPLLVYSDFDYPQADLLGALLNFGYQSSDSLINLQNDLIFHSELYSMPVQDWALSDVISARFFKMLTIGGGISLSNYFSVYQGKYGRGWMDPYFEPKNLLSNRKVKMWIKDTTTGDSALFDWKSIKLMYRMAFDPKRLLSRLSFIPIEIFGKNDLVLYGEADLIGLKNYPAIYTHLMDRTFFCAGFNVPTFKVFDVLSAEIEYCRDTSAFSDEGFYAETPSFKPQYLVTSLSTLPVKRNTLRWSVYLKKSILNDHVAFIGQVACDHKKINFYYFKIDAMSFIETLPETNNWWWSFKTEFSF